MADLASFWMGPALGQIELASALSFLAQGDRLTLYSYQPVENVPAGVELRDAAEILSGKQIIRHAKTGSPALHSDLFRYQLLNKTDKIWVDLDILALRSFEGLGEWIVAYETETELNGAVLRLPRGSASLQELLQYSADSKGVPPYLTGGRRLKYQAKSLLARGLPVAKWPWGSIGPRALTHHLNKTGEIKHALPQQTFYAINLDQTEQFLRPQALTRAKLPAQAYGVHLWANKLRGILDKDYGGQVPRDSFLRTEMDRLGL